MVGEFGDSITAPAGPETYDQVPLPNTGVLPETIVVVAAHNAWLAPAFAALSTFICTLSDDEVQVPLETVQLNT